MDIDVFISHSHKDKALAEAVVQFFVAGIGIEHRDIRCTSHASTGLDIGSAIAKALRKDIERCSFVILLLTPNTASSEFVTFEMGAAWALDKHIVPLVSGLEPLRVPALLSGLLCCSVGDEEGLLQLADTMARDLFYAKDRPSANQMLSAARALARYAP